MLSQLLSGFEEMPRLRPISRVFQKIDPVVGFLILGLLVLTIVDHSQFYDSVRFMAKALLGILPFLILSIAFAAYAKASDADQLIARAFSGHIYITIVVAALVGAMSPFCSCGVIPLIAALLAMRVPLAPVMAFWLASPLMDPSMFLLTLGTLGTQFAVYKTLAAIGIGLIGGFGTYALVRGGVITQPLREGFASSCCGSKPVADGAKPIQWKFWSDAKRRRVFGENAVSTFAFLGKWLAIAFFLESLMLSYIPAESISQVLGGEGLTTVLVAAGVGVPAYLNGYAALPLVGGLIEQGMAPGAGMAFLIAGGVSSIPAAIAVWALARPPVFAAYLGFAFTGAIVFGYAYSYV